MKIREIYTVFPRKLKTGTVFYYQCYDKGGKRTNGRSTGQRTKTAARAYCMGLYREGKLVPGAAAPTFAEYAAGWWDAKTCKYLQRRQVQSPICPATVHLYRNGLSNHLLPHFGGWRLSAITAEAIANWQVKMSGLGLGNATINISTGILRVMLGEAVRRKLVEGNPALSVERLKESAKEKVILKPGEAARLLPAEWETVWESRAAYLMNKLAACTGMRVGELLGLKTGRVHEGHVEVREQFGRFGLAPTKTGDSRRIPVTAGLRDELLALAAGNGGGFVFSHDGGGSPVGRAWLYAEVSKAFEKIGISKKEQQERGLAMHHWRHFLNTALLMANVNTLKVQKVTGHKTEQMTRHYSHFDTGEFAEVLEVQRKLIGGA